MLSRWLSRAAMYRHRFRVWLAEFQLWATLAFTAAILCVVIAWATNDITRVIAVGALSITLAILSTRENQP